MKIQLHSSRHVLRVARSLRTYFPDVPLATCQEWVAKILGWRDLHELTAGAAKHPQPDPLDEQCSTEDVERRRVFQARRLSELSGRDPTTARAIVDELAPSGTPGGTTIYDKLVHAYSSAENGRALGAALAVLRKGGITDPKTRAFVDVIIMIHGDERPTPDELVEISQILARAGDAQARYYAANVQLERATTPADFEAALRAFRSVVADPNAEDTTRAASIVNSTPIIRDGLISGKPDWPAALAAYEEAARMGMVVAMYNAATVSRWMSGDGGQAWDDKAAYWYAYALDHCAQGKPTLDFSGRGALHGILDSCALELAGMHIDGAVANASIAEAFRLLRTVRNLNEPRLNRYKGVAYPKVIRELNPRPHESFARNWISAFEGLGWTFDPEIEPIAVTLADGTRTQVEVALAMDGDARTPVVVAADACLPHNDRLARLAEIATALGGRYERFMLVARKALCQVNAEQDVSTAAWLQAPGMPLTLAPIAASSFGPARLFEMAAREVGFPADKDHCSPGYLLAIAVNTLDEGMSAASTMDGNVRWSGSGAWRMPFVHERELFAYGLVLGEALQ